MTLAFRIPVALALLAAVPGPPFAAFERFSQEPALSPRGDGFESAGTFNPAVIATPEGIVMLYRAQDKHGTSRLGYASSADGVHFCRRPDPVLSPEAQYEKDGGVEDPRLVKIDDSYYLTYTGYNTIDAQLCLAKSSDLLHWQRLGVIMPANRGRWNVHWTKSGAILNQRVNGHYWMYFMGDARDGANQMGVAYSDDLVHWTEPLGHPVLRLRPGRFDSKVVEPGPPPVLTPNGILLVYNGADDKLVYRTGWALFDKSHPDHLLARSEQPMFAPDLPWEKQGQVPNVVFVEGMLPFPVPVNPALASKPQQAWTFYYGGADMRVGIAIASLRLSDTQ
jgi:beta-1,2-mannosidase